jgi:hypothetical protein
MFKLALKLDMVAVPFPGGGPMIQSVIGGHTPTGHRPSRRQADARRHRLRADRERACGIRRAHQDGSAKMDEADPRCQYQGGMTDAS